MMIMKECFVKVKTHYRNNPGQHIPDSLQTVQDIRHFFLL